MGVKLCVKKVKLFKQFLQIVLYKISIQIFAAKETLNPAQNS
jgi:hypothetical protein